MQVCVVHPQKTWLCAHRLWLWLRLAFLFNQDPRARFSMSFVQSLVLIPVLHGGFPLASWKVYTIFLLQPRGHSRVRLEMSKKCQLPPLLACLWSYSDSFLTHQLRSAFRIVFFFSAVLFSIFSCWSWQGYCRRCRGQGHCRGLLSAWWFIYSMHFSVLTSFFSRLSLSGR